MLDRQRGTRQRRYTTTETGLAHTKKIMWRERWARERRDRGTEHNGAVCSYVLLLCKWAIWCAKGRVYCTFTPKRRCNLPSKEQECSALTAAWKARRTADSYCTFKPSPPPFSSHLFLVLFFMLKYMSSQQASDLSDAYWFYSELFSFMKPNVSTLAWHLSVSLRVCECLCVCPCMWVCGCARATLTIRKVMHEEEVPNKLQCFFFFSFFLKQPAECKDSRP